MNTKRMGWAETKATEKESGSERDTETQRQKSEGMKHVGGWYKQHTTNAERHTLVVAMKVVM